MLAKLTLLVKFVLTIQLVRISKLLLANKISRKNDFFSRGGGSRFSDPKFDQKFRPNFSQKEESSGFRHIQMYMLGR
jgi:hypothetical protein